MEAIARAGEQVSPDPEEVEARLQGVVSAAHGSLGLGYLGLEANVSEHLRVEVEKGRAGHGATFEEPLVRGPLGAASSRRRRRRRGPPSPTISCSACGP